MSEEVVVVETEETVERKPIVPALEFLTAWENSRTVKEVADKTNLTVSAVSTRAKAYRKAGVRLKVLEAGLKGRKLDVDRLNQILEDLRKQ